VCLERGFQGDDVITGIPHDFFGSASIWDSKVIMGMQKDVQVFIYSFLCSDLVLTETEINRRIY
jgi:hypothetical protein